MTVADLLRDTPKELRRDAEIILSHLLKIKTALLPLKLREPVSEEIFSRFCELIEKRRRGVPTAYLTGEWEFMGHLFLVEEGVLVPRPETELLVEKALENIPEEKPLRGFEVGVGTGCISISLLLRRKLLYMEGSDMNPVAVSLASKNAELHGVKGRLTLHHGSFMEPAGGFYDLIVSNPPYIPLREWEKLPPEVKREGRNSLIAGETGLEAIERIVRDAKDFLKRGGFVILEIGHDQGREVQKILEGGGFRAEVFKDLSGQDRIAIGWS